MAIELKTIELKGQVESLTCEGQKGKVYSFPSLQDRGLAYLLTSSDWDMSLGQPGGAEVIRPKDKPAPWQEIKDFFQTQLGGLGDGQERQFSLLRQIHSSRLIDLDSSKADGTAEYYDFKNRQGEIQDSQSQKINCVDRGVSKPEDLGFALRYIGADGLMTSRAKDITASTHADCAPILIYDRTQNRLLNLHSGWRGTLDLFPLHSLSYLICELGADVKDLTVVLGPMIAAQDYEVEADLAVPFQAVFPEEAGVIRKRSEFKYDLDLKAAILWQLQTVGLETGQVFAVEGSTFADTRFHSYRRDGKDDYGLMMSFAALCEQTN